MAVKAAVRLTVPMSHNQAAKRASGTEQLEALASICWAWCLTGRYMVLDSQQPHADLSAKATHQKTVICNCSAFSQRGVQLLHSKLMQCQRLSRTI